MNWKQRIYLGIWGFIVWVLLGWAASREGGYGVLLGMFYFMAVLLAFLGFIAFWVGAIKLFSILGDKKNEQCL